MIVQLLKYIDESGKARQVIVDPNTDVADLKSIRLGGIIFNETNIVTVSGPVNSLLAEITKLSGASSIEDDLICQKVENVSSTLNAVDVFLQLQINGVSSSVDDQILELSGASSLRDDFLQLQIDGVSSSVDDKCVELSGASSLRDDFLQLQIDGVSSTVDDLIVEISGASSLRDDFLQLQIDGVSSSVDDKCVELSGASSLRDDFLQLQIDGISGKHDDEIVEISGASSLRDDALQSQINAILSAQPNEVLFQVTGTETTFNVSGLFSFDPDNTIKDIEVFRNTSRKYIATDGVSGDYAKNSAVEIEYLHPLVVGDKIAIRKESGGALDLENIGVDPSPAVDGGQKLGRSTRAWDCIVLKDQATGNNFEIAMISGVLTATLV